MKYRLTVLALLIAVTVTAHPTPAFSSADFQDLTHWSNTFQQQHHYRIILPVDYETSGKRYPVVYYFHGHSSRYCAEPYGDGQQVSLPAMIDYVKSHDVIAVRWDGYVEKSYSSFYSGSPYDIQPESGEMDFGPYFLELVAHIDSTFRTVADRQHRGTCGLSMGGFMSLYLAGRYPDVIGSASSYNPGHEFWVGAPGTRVLYFLKDHVRNNYHQKIRLIRNSGDYISQYHLGLNEVYSRTPEVDYCFRQEEYHRHWVNGLAETLDFHLDAFADKSLADSPRSFDHDNAWPRFSLWGWSVEVGNKKAGYVCLRYAQFGYLRVFTRAWAPDGPAVEGQSLTITTPDMYGNAKTYRIMDYSHRDRSVKFYELRSSRDGRLTFTLDGSGHDISVLNGQEARAPVLLPLSQDEEPVVFPDRTLHLPLRFINTCGVTVHGLRFSLASEYPTASLEGGEVEIDSLAPGQVIDLSERFSQRFVSTSGEMAHCRLNVHVTWKGWYGQDYRVDVRVLPSPLAGPDSVLVLDGRKLSLPVFRQKGNQGGGSVYQRTVEEGRGNGNGIAEPGEEVTVWVRTPQGLDPLDKGTWHRAKVFCSDSAVTVCGDIAESKELEWTSVQDHTSRLRVSPTAAPGSQIELALKNESYCYYWQPDYRYGKELLLQAFQFHRNHCTRLMLQIGGR